MEMLWIMCSRCLLWEAYKTHKYILWAECSPYLTGNTLRLRYRAQPVNAVWGNSRCLLWEAYKTHKYILWAECSPYLQETHYVSATEPNLLMLFRETVAVYCDNHTGHTDTLCGRMQFVPHRKHNTFRLQSPEPNRLMLFRKQSASIVRTIQNTQIHSVGRLQSFSVLEWVVSVVTVG
jgi:hypothetical protein